MFATAPLIADLAADHRRELLADAQAHRLARLARPRAAADPRTGARWVLLRLLARRPSPAGG